MIKTYIFRSSKTIDKIYNLRISTNSTMRALALAIKYFNKNNAVGVPQLILN